ncbi:MAG TPA: imidazole glycerol phosphate synthase subunit HisH [Rhodospirillales bacterium]|jgi:glutamine amidotransferase|nr:imidazole glycerol phosphate synthase subunit HisH [Rhodospirillales bacterium]
MSVVIIDYGSGNLRSAAKAFERAVAEAGSTETVTVTADPATVAGAGRVVLPGVGAFGDCMGGLAALPGMLEALDGAVIRGGKPFLGICVGMELMAEMGREHGDHTGLGWIPGEVAALALADAALKIPHMGWNELAMTAPGHPVLAGIAPGAHAYFVHSYALVCTEPAHVLATVEYGGSVTAAVGRDNMIGTQFHPEKSQATGLRLITNFLGWRP